MQNLPAMTPLNLFVWPTLVTTAVNIAVHDDAFCICLWLTFTARPMHPSVADYHIKSCIRLRQN